MFIKNGLKILIFTVLKLFNKLKLFFFFFFGCIFIIFILNIWNFKMNIYERVDIIALYYNLKFQKFILRSSYISTRSNINCRPFIIFS